MPGGELRACRSGTFVTFGLAGADEPWTGTVQADVLYGADGTARAVRFVGDTLVRN